MAEEVFNVVIFKSVLCFLKKFKYRFRHCLGHSTVLAPVSEKTQKIPIPKNKLMDEIKIGCKPTRSDIKSGRPKNEIGIDLYLLSFYE